jgi:hypothetical protein
VNREKLEELLLQALQYCASNLHFLVYFSASRYTTAKMQPDNAIQEGVPILKCYLAFWNKFGFKELAVTAAKGVAYCESQRVMMND